MAISTRANSVGLASLKPTNKCVNRLTKVVDNHTRFNFINFCFQTENVQGTHLHVTRTSNVRTTYSHSSFRGLFPIFLTT